MSSVRPRRTWSRRVPLVAGLAALALVWRGPLPGGSSVAADVRPSFVFVIVDDLDVTSVERLPGLIDRIAARGVTFTNGFANQPTCCPSRVSMLRGEYTHNHGILRNSDSSGSCFETFRDWGLEASTLARWLGGAGYRTGFVGKYLNRYPGTRDGADPTYVPSGWDEWSVPLFEPGNAYFDYSMNLNGRVVAYGTGEADYMTDALADRAVEFIRNAGEEPFFLQLNPPAPHRPATPAPRHALAFDGLLAPRTPSFNEADMSDKPVWYRENLTPMTQGDIDRMDDFYRNRLRTMLAVDEMLERVDAALLETGRFESTYLVFVSDHGFHLGQHRFRQGKSTPYEPAIRIPFMMRGPRVPVGRQLEHLVTAVDLPATLAELAGIVTPGHVDGRSLVPLLADTPPAPETWRSEVLIERLPVAVDEEDGGIPAWWGLRTTDAMYAEYETGEVEYYDLLSDPDQLENLHDRVDPALLDALRERLDEWLSCAGPTCG
jgi:N-acetylglucosamine-6-sulfatase